MTTTITEKVETTRADVELWFDRTFNQIHMDIVEAYAKDNGYDYLGEPIQNPSFAIMVEDYFDNYDIDNLCKEYQDEGNVIDPIKGFVLSEDQDFIKWLEENKQDEILEAFNESEHYPMSSTLFEFKSEFDATWAMERIDELYNIGIGVIEGFENLNACLFISGCGYDFYEAHWMPLHKLYRS